MGITNAALRSHLKVKIPRKRAPPLREQDADPLPFNTVEDKDLSEVVPVRVKFIQTFNSLTQLPFYSVNNFHFMHLFYNYETGDLPQPSLDFMPRQKSALNIVALNCQSVHNKMTELRLMTSEHNVSIIAVTESWLTKSHKEAEVTIEGFKTYRTDRKPKQWGTLLYTRVGLSVCQQYTKLNIPSDVFKIAGNGIKTFILINNYRPCDSNENWTMTYDSLLL